VLDKYVVESNFDKNFKSNELISYYLMILSNLTTSELGQKKFLSFEEKEQKGKLFLKYLDFFFKFVYNKDFDFCSNIIANISSLKEGRLLILENGLFAIFVSNFDRVNNFQLTNILRLVRNCIFEFEKHLDNILVQKAKLFNILAKVLILANIKDSNTIKEAQTSEIDAVYFTHLNSEKAFEEREIINDLVIDILLVLTNSESGVITMKEKKLKKVFDIIRKDLSKDPNLADRVFVITNYLDN